MDTQDSSSLNVKQFQYTDWPEESVPTSGSGLIDLIGQVQKWQRNSGDRPIIVHCRCEELNKSVTKMIEKCSSLSPVEVVVGRGPT